MASSHAVDATDLRTAWRSYWSSYADENERRMRTVAGEYPVERGVEVSYRDLMDHGVAHETFRAHPDDVLGIGVETFGESVADIDVDAEDAWPRGFDAMILHVVDLPDGYGVYDYANLMEYLDRLVQIPVTLDADPDRMSDLMEAAFVCLDGHVTRLHQPGRRRREIRRCPECGDDVYLEERDSLFAEILRVQASGEGFDDKTLVVGGRRWKRLGLAAGDPIRVVGIPRADFRGDSTHGDVYVDVLSLERIDDLPF